MLISLNKWKWLEICFKTAYGEWLIYWIDIWCRYTLELPQRSNSNVYLQHYATENKEENYLEIYIFQVFTSFKHLKLPICIKIPFCWYLHSSYITKFDFMKYAFVKLLLARLYKLLSVSERRFE